MEIVLITGGGGSLGAELALLLSRKGRSVRIFDLPGLDYSLLSEVPMVEVFCGNITDKSALRQAACDVGTVIHLAALLPPVTEEDWVRTEVINVEGTANLLETVREENKEAHFIFSSSVTVYGNADGTNGPLVTDHELRPGSYYARSKALAEKLVIASKLPYTILRISGVAIPAFLEPPPIWPFNREQRIEFVCREDVITALYNSVDNNDAHRKVFNIAGGKTWRMPGYHYVESIYNLMGVPPEEARYLEHPGDFAWYDTSDSQAVLQYQQTTHQTFLNKLEQAVRNALL